MKDLGLDLIKQMFVDTMYLKVPVFKEFTQGIDINIYNHNCNKLYYS